MGRHPGSFRPGFDPRRYRSPVTPAADRFWPLVERTPGCWLWTGARYPRGYGNFNVHGRGRPAHRVAWELTHGPIPDGRLVCHACDNPGCVRPDHLFLGTQSDNMCDMAAKGRHAYPRGEDHPQARLSNADRAEIRRLYAAGAISQAAIAERFGVCQSHVSRIVRRFRKPRKTAAPVLGPTTATRALAKRRA